MPIAYNKSEAIIWFENNDDPNPGPIVCELEDGTQKECSCYHEASAFFSGIEYVPLEE